MTLHEAVFEDAVAAFISIVGYKPAGLDDPQSRNHLFGSLELLRGEGLTVLYSTHYLEEAEAFCDRIAIMCRGTLGPPRDARDCTEHQLMLEATGQEAA